MKTFRFIISLYLILVYLVSQAFAEKIIVSQKLTYQPYLETNCITNHQGVHSIEISRALLKESGHLEIVFPPNNAYFLAITLIVENDNFISEISGIPFRSDDELKYKIKEQSLSLNKLIYAENDVLYGLLSISFSGINQQTKKEYSFYLKGHFSTIVRSENFEPAAPENIELYSNQIIAIHELGLPTRAHQLSFHSRNNYAFPDETTQKNTLHKDIEQEYRQRTKINIDQNIYYIDEQLNISPFDNLPWEENYDDSEFREKRIQLFREQNIPEIVIRELIFPLDEEAQFTGKSDKFVAIWFVKEQNSWKQIGFKIFHSKNN